jgi:hypothetical protein
MCFRGPAKGFGILGLIFIVLLLSGVSCGGGSTTTSVSKIVSDPPPQCWVCGFIWHDIDEDHAYDPPTEHGVADIDVVFLDYGSQPWTPYYGTTDMFGTYVIGNIPDGHTGRVVPCEYADDYDTYYPLARECTVHYNQPVMGQWFAGYTE